ncbi:AUGMIN subunit 6-like [Phalaenopsis equestris]|uniref:AUGMIN subunit 6-like n=1 Tax=Phalaenopsis equestris TaxID=78828 RepID=UPI0009E3AA9D|nr:AUGMIN subunit 6-like [Phalaenopsis equestris]
MAMGRDDRESELESAMYTNCLLLGLDPAIIGVGGAEWKNGVGYFRHSNPRLGEKLLYFLLSSLRGPAQSAKDFDRVWPISDSSQSRDFRKIVQGIISELESKGALPRSSARVSSLATCCGPRFVELLWQLSVHALREVYKRTFSTDVSSNPLPASLTDVSYLNAASLLPVTMARIALERRKFLKDANLADQRQTMWSNLANEMTAEFRELCAEEAYLKQELEKLQEIRNKAKLEGELWDDRISSSTVQNSLLISKATRLWESLLSRKSQHEVLASGPIEDLITHREHRYRISGSSLAAAMDLSCNIPHSDLLATTCTGKMLPSLDTIEQSDLPQFQGNSQILSRTDDRDGRVNHTVDVAEILRRWTHALQHIHKQSLHMAKANDGEGSELLHCLSENGSNGHTESLAATLAEHKQHLVSLQELVNQLKAAVPTMQKSIMELTKEVNTFSPISIDVCQKKSISPVESHSNGRTANIVRSSLTQENTTHAIVEMASNLSSKASDKPALKLPHLFNLTPSWSRKSNHLANQQNSVISQPEKLTRLSKETSVPPLFGGDDAIFTAEDSDMYARNLRLAVREAALSGPSNNSENKGDKINNAGSEHFFIPLLIDVPQEEVGVVDTGRKEHLFSSCESEESLELVLSPTYLQDEPVFDDCYEDLLAPLSDTDAALMETYTLAPSYEEYQ